MQKLVNRFSWGIGGGVSFDMWDVTVQQLMWIVFLTSRGKVKIHSKIVLLNVKYENNDHKSTNFMEQVVY